jgi:hypothetical protein
VLAEILPTTKSSWPSWLTSPTASGKGSGPRRNQHGSGMYRPIAEKDGNSAINNVRGCKVQLAITVEVGGNYAGVPSTSGKIHGGLKRSVAVAQQN